MDGPGAHPLIESFVAGDIGKALFFTGRTELSVNCIGALLFRVFKNSLDMRGEQLLNLIGPLHLWPTAQAVVGDQTYQAATVKLFCQQILFEISSASSLGQIRIR